MVEPTHLERSDTLSHGTNEVFIKRTDLLPGGGFKFLSAMTYVAMLREAGFDGDFVVPTAGTYGVAMGHATVKYGGGATAVTPVGSNAEKQRIMQDMGVEVVEHGDNFDEANQYALGYADRHGARYVHPFASIGNLAGTGVLGLELADDLPDMTHAVSPYGGGSLNGGLGLVLQDLMPEVHLRTVQVRGCAPFVDSIRSGEVREAEDQSSHIMRSYFARLGGVGVGRTHPLTLGVGSRVTDSVDVVRNDYVYATMHDVKDEHGVLPEFAGAVSLEGARRLAREGGLENAVIVAFLTGSHANDYPDGYLAGMSGRRRDDERYS